MTTPLTITEIERRLRFAAPDEPAVLPALALPVASAPFSRLGVRIRPRAFEPQGVRLGYVLVGLLLVAAAITAGAMLLLNDDDPLADACAQAGLMVAEPGVDPCLELKIPDGWHQLGAGQLSVGTNTEEKLEDGLQDNYVALVIANVPLGGCPSPVSGPPAAIPSGGNEFHVPEPGLDPGLACLRDLTLPENGIRLEVIRGSRTLGVDSNGMLVPDTSEPTAEAGWAEEVAGRPARLTVAEGQGLDEPVETRTWDVLTPRSLESVLRITADIAGPDRAAGRAAVQEFVDSIRFKTETPPLDAADANDALRRVLDAADASARGSRSDFYGCFPREPGSADGTISGGPSAGVSDALAVTCSSAISPSAAGVWRIVLEVQWDGTSEYEGDTLRMQLFTSGKSIPGALGDPIDWNGGYITSLAGRPMPPEGPEAWLPTAKYELPPPLSGPLNLPRDSVVEMLWPGEYPAGELGPGAPEDSLYPGMVGAHMYVLEGPVLDDGDEWYRVQFGSGSFDEIGWVRGTRDGRPQLEVVQPDCPGDELTVGELSWLTAGERLPCFGGREITVGTAILSEQNAWGSPQCQASDGSLGECPEPLGEPRWLTADPHWSLYGRGGPHGPEPAFLVWLDPSLDTPQANQLVRIRGHFDDPAARGCVMPSYGQSGYVPNPVLDELRCRWRFVVTAVEPLS